MPITPLHIWQGTILKALLQGSFSLMVFGWAQIIMDIQPLYVVLADSRLFALHGFSHTYLGATLLAVVSALSGKYVAAWGLTRLKMPEQISWLCAFFSAFLGTYSHVVLDSIMHDDIQPFFPFSLENPFMDVMTIEQLHWFCLISGFIGSILYYFIKTIKDRIKE